MVSHLGPCIYKRWPQYCRNYFRGSDVIIRLTPPSPHYESHILSLLLCVGYEPSLGSSRILKRCDKARTELTTHNSIHTLRNKTTILVRNKSSDYTTLHYSTLHYTTLHDTTRYDTTRHYTTRHYTTLNYTTLRYATRYATRDATRHYTTIHYTTLHYTTLHYITLHYTTPHYTALHDITLHYTTLHYTKIHYTTLHYTTLHYITLHYTTLHYASLHYTTLPVLSWEKSQHETQPEISGEITNSAAVRLKSARIKHFRNRKSSLDQNIGLLLVYRRPLLQCCTR